MVAMGITQLGRRLLEHGGRRERMDLGGSTPWLDDMEGRGAAQLRLGIEIRKYRIARGMTQARLAREIGLSAHSNISDYEAGRRLPPMDILQSFESVLCVNDRRLCEWRDRALTERARLWAARAVEAMREPPAVASLHPPREGGGGGCGTASPSPRSHG